MKKSIGKNTLGGGNKMEVNLKTYSRSTHNLSYAWRSTMGVGTLVPFMKILAMPGDTFDIDLESKILTHPTVGPLFGSFKFQADVFTCPIRLYNAMLHNNALNIGLNMETVKLPKLARNIYDNSTDTPTEENPWSQIHPSCLLAYLGNRGWGTYDSKNHPNEKGYQRFVYNAVPLLSYFDIFKCFYANKQEEIFYTLGGENNLDVRASLTVGSNGIVTKGYIGLVTRDGSEITEDEVRKINLTFIKDEDTGRFTESVSSMLDSGNFTIMKLENGGESSWRLTYVKGTYYKNVFGYLNKILLKEWELTEIDKTREQVLSLGSAEGIIDATGGNINQSYLKQFVERELGESPTNALKTNRPNFGLAIKTHQSDIFNNWINTEWIDGDNGINAITAVDTSSGSFTIDQLNLSKKVYEMLNRIAISGGSYRDWIETVYTTKYTPRPETPIYEGGMSDEIIFQEVISNSATKDEPLGTLAGRGTSAGRKKGGKLHIRVEEPSYIIGICSITPRVDYCQGNDFDCYLDTMNDIHKPQLDGIGFQDLTTEKMAWFTRQEDFKSIGKQPAWLDYMTNYNKTYGNFAIEGNESFMVLNKYFDPAGNGKYNNGTINASTYINPEDFNYIFADTSLESQNFWAQIGIGIKARRLMSAKVIPNP